MDNKKKVVTAEDYDRVIKASVARYLKRYGFGWDRYKDWVQQMWVEVLEDGNKKGKPNNLPDLALVPTICYRRLGDIFKKEGQKRLIKPAKDMSDEDLLKLNIENSENSENFPNRFTEVPFDPAADYLIGLENEESGKDLVYRNLRPSIDKLWDKLDDKEKEYFKFWLEKVDIEDFGIHPPVPDNSKPGPNFDGYQEDFIAKRLGFPSGTAASYRRFRDNFRKKVKRYVGNLEKY